MPTNSKPKYCITLDTDWASDFAIEYSLELITSYGIKPTVFATNESKILQKYISDDKIEIGLHPNFLPNSTHGKDYSTVIEHVFKLYPTAKTFRSHAYFDNSLISREFYSMGFKFDANLCLHLQENIFPMKHESGLLRFPTFLEDGVFLFYQNKTELSETTFQKILSEGLKIFNFHPISIFLNLDTLQSYNKHRMLAKSLAEEHLKLACRRFGARTLLTNILELVKNNDHNFYTLNELYETYNSGS